jgi:hypothetical protein
MERNLPHWLPDGKRADPQKPAICRWEDKGLPFWQQETFDHWVPQRHILCENRCLYRTQSRLLGLVKNPADWLWSSAHK